MQWGLIRFYKVEAESIKDGKYTEMNVNLDVKGVQVTSSGDLRIDFSYGVDYRPNIAKIKFQGYLTGTDEKEELEKIAKTWKKEKRLDKELAQQVINVVTFNGEVNGVLVSKAINIVPPIISSRIEIDLGRVR